MKKNLVIIVIIVLFAGVAYYASTQNQAKAPADENSSSGQNQDQAAVSQNNQATTTAQNQASTTPAAGISADVGGTFSSGEEMDGGEDIQVVKIVYDGSKYTPNTADIKVNDYVIFQNSSDTDFWPASAVHPSHTNYPEFDAKKPIAPGGKFQFQFTKEGGWGFHDHLNPSAFGKITVTK